MAARIPLLSKPGEGRRIVVGGDLYRVLATGAETGGAYAMIEALVPPGGGPPPHIHTREEEAFYVLEGEVAFYLDGARVVATAGMFANVPKGCLHRFSNESGKPAKMLIQVTPAGLEDLFFEVGTAPDADGHPTPPTTADIERLLAAAPRFGIEIRIPAH